MLISTEETNMFEAWGVEFDEGVFNKLEGVYVSCVTPMTWNTEEPTVTVGFVPTANKDQAFILAKQLRKISLRSGFLDCEEIEGFITLCNYERLLTQEADCASFSFEKKDCNITEIPVIPANEGFRLVQVY